MGKIDYKHTDCIYFSNVDAAKGICRISGEITLIDSPVCENFERKASCKLCRNFRKTVEPTIGECLASKEGYWSYEDLNAENCENYSKIGE